jgi:hypothetical protein
MEDERSSAEDETRREGQAGSSGPGSQTPPSNSPPPTGAPPAPEGPSGLAGKPSNSGAPPPTGAAPPPPPGQGILTANDFTSGQIGRLMQCLRVKGVTNRARLEAWLGKFDGSADEALVEAEGVLTDWEKEQAKPAAAAAPPDPQQSSLGLDSEPVR